MHAFLDVHLPSWFQLQFLTQIQYRNPSIKSTSPLNPMRCWSSRQWVHQHVSALPLDCKHPGVSVHRYSAALPSHYPASGLPHAATPSFTINCKRQLHKSDRLSQMQETFPVTEYTVLSVHKIHRFLNPEENLSQASWYLASHQLENIIPCGGVSPSFC